MTPDGVARSLGTAPSVSGRADRRWLAAIIVVGLLVRVAWGLYAVREPVGLHDPTFYRIFADALAAGRGYQLPDGQVTAYYPVGYPAALASVYWLFDGLGWTGGRANLHFFLNLVAAGLSFPLLYVIGRRLFDHRVGLLAAAGLALMPNLVFHTSLALTETVFNTVALAAVALVVSSPWDGRSNRSLAAFGALVGIAALVRPPSLLFVPVLAVAGARAAGWRWRETGRSLIVPALAAAVVIAPWTVRNIVVMDAPILISSNVGDNLCIGNNPDASGAFQTPPSCLEGYDHLERPEYEVRRDNDGRAKALEFLVDEPARQLELVPLRLYHTFREDTDGLDAAESYGEDPFIDASLRRVLGILANVTFFVTLALGVAAPALLRRREGTRDPGRTFVVLSGLSLALTPLAFFGDPRFHVPVVPFLLLGAAALAVTGARRIGIRAPRTA